MRNIRQNLFFAFVYNALGVPIAAGVLYPLFGLLLSPMIAAAAMSLQLGLGDRQRAMCGPAEMRAAERIAEVGMPVSLASGVQQRRTDTEVGAADATARAARVDIYRRSCRGLTRPRSKSTSSAPGPFLQLIEVVLLDLQRSACS